MNINKFNLVLGILLLVVCISLITMISLQMQFLNIHIRRISQIGKIEWTYIIEYFIALICGILAIFNFRVHGIRKNSSQSSN